MSDVDPRVAANDPGGRPLGVLPLMAECAVGKPAQMTLLSIERWSTFFAVRWFFATHQPTGDIDRRLQAKLQWTATDDLGNAYTGGDFGGGGGNSPRWTMTSWFAPPLCGDAQSLTIRFPSPVDGSRTEVVVSLR